MWIKDQEFRGYKKFAFKPLGATNSVCLSVSLSLYLSLSIALSPSQLCQRISHLFLIISLFLGPWTIFRLFYMYVSIYLSLSLSFSLFISLAEFLVSVSDYPFICGSLDD